MTLDLAFLLSLGCVFLAGATRRLVVALPELAGELGVSELPEDALVALERGLEGFRKWVLFSPLCWILAFGLLEQGARGASGHPAHTATGLLAEGAALLPLLGILMLAATGLWRFAEAVAHASVEEEDFLPAKIAGGLIAAAAAISAALAGAGAWQWILHLR